LSVAGELFSQLDAWRGEGDASFFNQVAYQLLSFDERTKHSEVSPPHFLRDAFETYLEALATEGHEYYLSVAELIAIAEGVNANVVVTEMTGDAYEVIDCCFADEDGEVAVVVFSAGASNRQRGHFERLCDGALWGAAASLTEATRKRREEEKEEEREKARRNAVERETQRRQEESVAREREAEVARLREDAQRKQHEEAAKARQCDVADRRKAGDGVRLLAEGGDEAERQSLEGADSEARDGATSKRQRLQERLKEQKRKREEHLAPEQAEKRRRLLTESTPADVSMEGAPGTRSDVPMDAVAEDSEAKVRADARAAKDRQLLERLDEQRLARTQRQAAAAAAEDQIAGTEDVDPDEASPAEEETEEDRAMAEARQARREVQFRGLFNVRVAPTRPRQTEPERMHVAAQSLAEHLRKHVTLPAHWADPKISYMDVKTGNRLPPVSCAFKECRWHGGNERVTRAMRDAAKDETTGAYEHPWDFQLRAHVLLDHAQVLESVLERLDLPRQAAWDVYKEALAVRERSTEQIAGPSIDRRSLEYTLQLYNDDMVRSLICGVCARIRVDTGHVHSDIEFKTGGWLLSLEDKHPGIIEKVCSQARFDKHYRQPGMPLAPTGNKGATDLQGPDFSDWQLTLHASLFAKDEKHRPRLKRLHEGQGNGVLLCCPEDHECEATCKQDRTLCSKCRIPICYECRIKLHADKMPPKALMNENFQGCPACTSYYPIHMQEARQVFK
jgi:hypothetical protein